jgi:hypothetical protein
MSVSPEVLKREILEAELTLLQNGGNQISSDHKLALEKIASLFVDAAFSATPFRYAVGLDTGLGKTTLLATYLLTLKAKNVPLRVLVCVPNLKAMQEFRQLLIDGGFGPEKVGCKFSGNDLPFESVRDNLDDYDVLIACHARVDGSRSDWSNLVSNRIVFYDEALKRGNVIEGTLPGLKLDVLALSEYLPDNLRDSLHSLLADLEGAGVDEIIPLCFPDDAAFTVDRAIKEYRRAVRKKKSIFDDLIPVVSSNYDALRNHNGNYFTFESTLPEMNSLFVLDANHSFSELSKLDSTIKILELPKFKRFDHVSFKAAHKKLSKTAILKNPDDYVQWALDLMTSNAAVICYKDMADMFSQGTNVITWGMHAGANSFAHLDTLICIGLLTMPHPVTKGHMTLVQDDLSASTDNYQKINADEALLDLYQAVSRGASRKVFVENDTTYACPSTIYLSGRLTQPQINLLKEVMPGCSYSLLEYDQAVSDIKQYFASKTFDDCLYWYISTKELVGALPSVAVLSKSARKAVESRLLEEGFYKSGRGFVKK